MDPSELHLLTNGANPLLTPYVIIIETFVADISLVVNRFNIELNLIIFLIKRNITFFINRFGCHFII